MRNRTLRFNYYAVLALKARVHLYAGNLDSARIAAQEVISSAKFPATALSAISGGNRTFSTEVIFNLNVNDIAILYAGFFNTSVRATKSVDQWNSWFEIAAGGSGDYRYLYQTALNGVYRLPVKLDGALNTNAAAAKKVPLMRLTEMYLIAAEAQLGTDNAAALTLVNTARRSRNLTDLPGTLTTPQIQQEIIKEYQKELLCEGQIFYLYKRLNLSELPYDFRSMNDEQYVLPLPDDELTYGRTK
ncbi:MAG: RagB/SusD family nutrient uptake outer membrane protein [Chitinophagaceae bacterium]|nr:RagB/SusD family nutrient uptake outer membrane protein [Chitinophagaceae bacterium]